MKTRFLRKTMAVAFVSAFAAYSVQASAAISLGFDQNSGFKVDNTLVSNDPGTPNNDIVWYASSSDAPSGTFGTIAWGLPNDQGGLKTTDPFLGVYSGLEVVGYNGTLTDAAWTSISSIYHVNTVIPGTAFVLKSAGIYSSLQLIGLGADTNTVSIKSFSETSNNGNCSSPNPQGSNCDDFFTFDLDDFKSINLVGNLWLDFRFFDVANATTLCTGNSCTTYTAEGVTSQLDVQGRLREIPEPATLALMGLGLLGLAGLKKRTKV